MGTPVTVLVVDPTRGFQREIEAGETLVDGDGNPILFPGYGPPVADIPALKAITADRRVDQQVRLVEDADPNTPGVDYPSNYAWDSSSIDADDPGVAGRPPAVVVPDDAPGTGRWIRVYSEVSPHYDIHELGGRDEITIENLVTDEYSASSSSSSPGAGDPIKVLVPDGGGGVQWIDLDLSIEELSTDELTVTKVLQPDGAGGVSWLDDLTLASGGKVILDTGKPTWFEAANDYMYCYADYGFDVEGDANADVSLGVYNNNIGAAAGVMIWAVTDGEGDAWVNLSAGGTDWSMGVDNDDGDTFKIHNANSLGAGGLFQLAVAGTLTLSGQIKNVTDPTAAQDAATKQYVDEQIAITNLSDILANGNDAMGQSIEGLCGIYFATGCGDGSSSSSSSGELVSWILPDNDRLHYHADGGHVFEDAVSLAGDLVSIRQVAPDRTVTFGWDNTDFKIAMSGISTGIEFFWQGSMYHNLERDALTLERPDGSSVRLNMVGYAVGASTVIDMTGVGTTTLDACRVELSGNIDWWISNRGATFIGEADDFLIKEGNAGAVWLRFDTSADAIVLGKDLDVVGHVETDDAYYLGAADVDGSWRIRRDDWDLVFEQRDSGGWNECDRISGCASSSSA